MDSEDEDWGEDFLKLMLGEEEVNLLTRGPPITTSSLHAHEPAPPTDGFRVETPSSTVSPDIASYANTTSAIEGALNALETALLEAGPNAINGPYTILSSVAGIVFRQFVPDKSIKLRDACKNDARFVFHADGVHSTVRLSQGHSKSGTFGASASTMAMNTLFQAVSDAIQLSGADAGIIVRQFVPNKQVKVKDLITEDGRFEIVRPGLDRTGPISVRLKRDHLQEAPAPPHPAPHERTKPTTYFLRERATPMWKKLSFHEKRSYGEDAKAFFLFAEALWRKESIRSLPSEEITGSRDDVRIPAAASHYQSGPDESELAREALASALVKVGPQGWLGPYTLLAGQAGTTVVKFTSKKLKELIAESPYFEWKDDLGPGKSTCSLTHAGRMHYLKQGPGPSPSTTRFLSSAPSPSKMSDTTLDSVRVHGPIISSLDPSFDLLLQVIATRNPTHVGITCQVMQLESGSSLVLELAFGSRLRGHVYRFDLLRADSSDIQTMLIKLKPLLFESSSIEKVSADSAELIEKILPFLPPGTRICPVFDLKVYEALTALPRIAKRASESLLAGHTSGHGGLSLGQLDKNFLAIEIIDQQRLIHESPSSLAISLALSLSQLYMDASTMELRNRNFGLVSSNQSLLSLSNDPSRWLQALMKLALDL